MYSVSIIIPFFKKKKYIDETINSILNQSYQNFEIIIIFDDTDLSDYNFLISKFGKNERIKILKNDVNLGAGYSRNIGIENSNGKFIAFLDADDIWHKDKLNNQINFMLNKNYEATHTSYKIVDERGLVQSKRKAKDMNFNNLLKSCDIGLSSVMIKREILKEDIKFPKLKTKEDYVLWLKIAKKGVIFYGLDNELLYWRKSKNSLSSSLIRKLIDGYYVYRRHMSYGIGRSLLYLLRLSLNYIRKND